MVSRERILEAAARVYAKYGFKGATTRLIAIEAGVNEVTLFRTFGSKGALLQAVLMQHAGSAPPPAGLPARILDPHAELSRFIADHLHKIAEIRPLLIHSMSELEDRPEALEFACRGRHHIHDTIVTYIRQMQEQGIADASADVEVAAVVITGLVIADVMGRAVVPELYPPLAEVASRYTSFFLRALGVRESLAAPEQTPIPETAKPPRSVGSDSPRSNIPSEIR